MNKPPEISVIVAARNQEKYIGRCIRSLLNQNFPRAAYEIIVVDDASTDKTAYALNLFSNEIRTVCNDTQLGLPGSLNRGIKTALGQFIVRVDGDDYVNAEFLNILHAFITLNTHMDAIACDYILVDDNENTLSRKNCMTDPIGCAIMFRIEHLIDVGLYDDGFLSHEDKDLRIRFLKRYGIHRVELPLYRYRRHSSNMTNNLGEMDKHYDRLMKKHGEENAGV